ncbi:MAG: hypothetical protein JZU65_24520 [Chlorobium sp.]|nr:hypothetical protein [Chlorobium sp.]
MENQMTKERVDCIADYLRSFCSDKELQKLYNFPIGKPLNEFKNYVKPPPDCIAQLIESAEKSAKSNDSFSPTLKLRKIISNAIINANQDEKIKIAEWIVKEWGGIPIGKNFKDCINDALSQHNAESEQNAKKVFKFERIASWSKFLAFMYPKEYAIYDARVVYSLNWILLSAGADKFFPVLEGRNSVMGLLDYKLQLLLTKHKKNEIVEKLEARKGNKTHFLSGLEKDVFYDKSKAFSEYCCLLREIAEKIYPTKDDPHALTKVEMILFSIADRDIAVDVLKCLAP